MRGPRCSTSGGGSSRELEGISPERAENDTRIELLDFQKAGWITGQNHPTHGRIMWIRNIAVIVQRNWSGTIILVWLEEQTVSWMSHTATVCGRISLCRVKYGVVDIQLASGHQSLLLTKCCMLAKNLSCCHTTFILNFPLKVCIHFPKRSVIHAPCCFPEPLIWHISAVFNCPSH